MFRTLILSAALLFSFPAYAQVERETSGSLGGTVINDDNIVLTGAFKHVTDTGPREYSFESDILYKSANGVTSREQINAFAKVNQDIHAKHYVQVGARYRHDPRTFSEDQAVYSIGHGYRIIKTEKTKLSNELSVGYKHGTGGYSDVVVRESVWLSHKLSNTVSVTNKFMIEQGSRTFIQNKAEVKYKLNEKTSFSIQDLYTKDKREDNTLSFAFTFKI
jgi:putative salt-induced outer membrane protein YdiY